MVVAKFLVSDLLFLQLFPWVRSWSGHNVPATASSAGLSHQQRVSLTHGQTQHHHLCQSAGLPVRAPTLLPETAQTHLSKKLCVQLWVCLMLLQPSLPVPLLSALLGRPCFATAPGKGTSKQTGARSYRLQPKKIATVETTATQAKGHAPVPPLLHYLDTKTR